MDLKHVTNAPPPRKTLDFFSRVTQRLLAWEEALKKGLVPKDLTPVFRRISDGAERTFGYGKDDLAGTFLTELTAYLASRKPKGLPEIYHRRLYDSALKEMELSYSNGAEQGAISVFYPAVYTNNQSPERPKNPETPERRFLTYYWSNKEIPFKKILEGLKNTQGSPLFNEETTRGAVNILCQYCQEQFVRGFSQGKGEAIWSPENLRKAVASLIPDRTQG
jgi:hypothetical protein